jgi:hypothetical protein
LEITHLNGDAINGVVRPAQLGRAEESGKGEEIQHGVLPQPCRDSCEKRPFNRLRLRPCKNTNSIYKKKKKKKIHTKFSLTWIKGTSLVITQVSSLYHRDGRNLATCQNTQCQMHAHSLQI